MSEPEDDALAGGDTPSAEALRALYDTAPLGFALLADDGRLRCANRSLQRILGWSEPELRRLTLAELTHPGDAAAEVAFFEELLAGKRASYFLHKRYVNRDGSVARVRQTIARHAAGDQAFIIALVEDVTAAQGTEERLRSLVHQLGERVKELTALHRTAELLLHVGSARDEQLQRVAKLLPGAMQFPEITTARINFGQQSYATDGHTETPWMLGARFETADGQTGAVEVAYHDARPNESDGPFLAEEVRLLSSIAGMIREAIDRQSTERALEERNDYLNLALAAAGMGIWDWDVPAGTVRWSPQLSHMLGLEGEVRGPVGGRSDLIHPDDRGLLRRLELAAEGADDLAGLSFRMKRSDGSWRVLEASAIIVRQPPARATRIIAALLDVTERRSLEERVRQLTGPAGG